jgi:hypothetical protein
LKYGYIDLDEYGKQWFKLSGNKKYWVDYSFPKLTRDNVPVGVGSASYELSLQAINSWHIN